MTSLSTRRELNKQATTQAIVNAVAAMIQNEQSEAITATGIANAAGISRRTLFNYFPTVDAVLSYPLHLVLDEMVSLISELTDTMPLAEALVAALESPEVTAHLELVAVFGAYANTAPAPAGFTPNQGAWHQATEEAVAKLSARYRDAEPFSIRVFTHAILGAGQAAFDAWIESLLAPSSSSPRISQDDVRHFRQLVRKSMQILDAGFAAVPLTASTQALES